MLLAQPYRVRISTQQKFMYNILSAVPWESKMVLPSPPPPPKTSFSIASATFSLVRVGPLLVASVLRELFVATAIITSLVPSYQTLSLWDTLWSPSDQQAP